jgi:hypothetical protein
MLVLLPFPRADAVPESSAGQAAAKQSLYRWLRMRLRLRSSNAPRGSPTTFR